MADIKFNINSQATIYPTQAGWDAMFIALEYKISNLPDPIIDPQKFIDSHKTPLGGYRDYLWRIIHFFGDVIKSTTYVNDEILLHDALSLKYVNKQGVCPMCDGEGMVPNLGGVSSSINMMCPVCMGSKVVINTYHY